jgi:hypothetical protein
METKRGSTFFGIETDQQKEEGGSDANQQISKTVLGDSAADLISSPFPYLVYPSI